jgi:hypothetical protein
LLIFEDLGQAESRGDFLLHGFHGHEYGGKHEVDHDEGPEYHHCHVEFVGALWSIAEREDEAGEERGEVEPFEDHAEDATSFAEQFGVSKRRGENVEDQEEVTLSSQH